jgi:hypothetical protein
MKADTLIIYLSQAYLNSLRQMQGLPGLAS